MLAEPVEPKDGARVDLWDRKPYGNPSCFGSFPQRSCFWLRKFIVFVCWKGGISDKWRSCGMFLCVRFFFGMMASWSLFDSRPNFVDPLNMCIHFILQTQQHIDNVTLLQTPCKDFASLLNICVSGAVFLQAQVTLWLLLFFPREERHFGTFGQNHDINVSLIFHNFGSLQEVCISKQSTLIYLSNVHAPLPYCIACII